MVLDRLTFFEGLGDDDFLDFFAGIFAVDLAGVERFLLLVSLSKILEENKVNFVVSIDETHVMVDVDLSTSNVTTRRKCNVSVACLLLRQL